ncbi:hypothetical protein Rsub_09139 [Raphidocelis subcapitata]|uniref:Uncharacterized protein n=1 Tax=Raphidocelis subcapitata TaxID=307507 RepID=A0A2V0P9N8_9CHLO|nr:hypothetical protein Rsub_09139 [Raphidocelis subcapitata]|eukprot:GBF96556.1 hypothetical protein Rsub_09139 [Raphidocelis subcapitata]
MQLFRASAGTSAVSARAPRRASSVRAAQVSTTDAASSSGGGGESEIYLGKGRVIRDDPRKYPGKEDLGVLTGATGGWAGGEAALWKLREELAAQKAASRGAAPPPPPAAPSKPSIPKPQGGKAPIYLGYSKSDADLRKVGAPGRFILDDPSKYPAKEDLGFFAGATGGFAAGEKGVKQFVRDGELQLRKEGQPGGQGASPVAIAGLLIAAGVGGGLVLNGAVDFTEGEIRLVDQEILQAPIDESTKTLLLVALGALGVAGLLGAGRAAASTLSERFASGAQRLVLLGAFWVVVFIAARAVLEL